MSLFCIKCSTPRSIAPTRPVGSWVRKKQTSGLVANCFIIEKLKAQQGRDPPSIIPTMDPVLPPSLLSAPNAFDATGPTLFPAFCNISPTFLPASAVFEPAAEAVVDAVDIEGEAMGDEVYRRNEVRRSGEAIVKRIGSEGEKIGSASIRSLVPAEGVEGVGS